MGSSSVYCNFSKITITSGDDCVLIPLLKSKNGNGIAHTNYHLFSLPIFGKYNDYQSIEKIEPSESNLIIEKYFGISIQDFCYKITEFNDEIITKNDSLIEKIEYCWVNKKVWNLLSTYRPNSSYSSYLNKKTIKSIDKLIYILGIKYFFIINNKISGNFTDFQSLYLENKNNDEILNQLIDIERVIDNSFHFSEYFKPFIPYCTPQCGEFETHQVFLNEFFIINQDKIDKDEI